MYSSTLHYFVMEPCFRFVRLDPTLLSALFHCIVGLSQVCQELSLYLINILLFIIPLMLLLLLLLLLPLEFIIIILNPFIPLHLHHHHLGIGGRLLGTGGILGDGLGRGPGPGLRGVGSAGGLRGVGTGALRGVGTGDLRGVGKGIGAGTSVKLSTKSSSSVGEFVVDDEPSFGEDEGDTVIPFCGLALLGEKVDNGGGNAVG
jgi:hypothetical protein